MRVLDAAFMALIALIFGVLIGGALIAGMVLQGGTRPAAAGWEIAQTCPNCGTVNGDGRGTCTRCGGTFK